MQKSSGPRKPCFGLSSNTSAITRSDGNAGESGKAIFLPQWEKWMRSKHSSSSNRTRGCRLVNLPNKFSGEESLVGRQMEAGQRQRQELFAPALLPKLPHVKSMWNRSARCHSLQAGSLDMGQSFQSGIFPLDPWKGSLLFYLWQNSLSAGPFPKHSVGGERDSWMLWFHR